MKRHMFKVTQQVAARIHYNQEFGIYSVNHKRAALGSKSDFYNCLVCRLLSQHGCYFCVAEWCNG